MKYFHDFLTFKFYYFDPLLINLNQVANCASDSESAYFDNWFRSTYATINDCLLREDNCEDVCAEFSLGTTGNMFVGDLKRSQEVLVNLKEQLGKLDQIDVDFLNFEFPEAPRNEFFTDGIGQKAHYVSGNLTRYGWIFMEKGIDLFEYAKMSTFGYDQGRQEPDQPDAELSTPAIPEQTDVTDPADNTPIQLDDGTDAPDIDTGAGSNTLPMNESDDAAEMTPVHTAKEVHATANQKLEDMKNDNTRPLPSEVAGLDNNIGSMEEQFIATLNQQTREDS